MTFTGPVYMVCFLIEEHLSVMHTSHVPLACVTCEPIGSAWQRRLLNGVVSICQICERIQDSCLISTLLLSSRVTVFSMSHKQK